MFKKIIPILGLLAFACEDSGPVDPTPTSFMITIENRSTEYAFIGSGVYNTPVGATAAGAIGAGGAYEFTFTAGPGSYLTFASMLVQSNDLFYAPAPSGIALFDASSVAISGDITSSIILWDAGTEVNEAPGAGPNQPLGGGTAGTTESVAVQAVASRSDGFTYPTVAAVLAVTITSSGTDFTVRIENVSTTTTISADSISALITPGVWAVHSASGAFFDDGSVDRGEGLEALAEGGDVSTLSASATAATGLTSPFAPGVWAVHTGNGELFTVGQADYGYGLETLAEDGDPSALASALSLDADIISSGAFDTPVGASAAGALLPGNSYQATFDAVPGDMLSFATMLVHTNDLFFAPGANGLVLFDASDLALSGDVTGSITLWDAGTEVNEEPGVGANQPARGGAATGTAEGGVVRSIATAADGFTYPSVGSMIKVTITPMP